MSRPKKYEISGEVVRKLAQLGSTNVEIADYFGCDESLIRKSYSEYLKLGRAEQNLRLRELQWQSAQKGSVPMQIWLGRNMLNQSENGAVSGDDEVLPFTVE
jgi:hypothetical protein